MIKLIRKNTFETNSSSCHTIVLLAKDVPKTTSVESNLYLSTGKYDCDSEIYTDVFNKLNYLFTFVSITGNYIEKFVSSLQEYFPNLKTIETDKGKYSLEEFKEILLDNNEYFLGKYDYINSNSISLSYHIFNDMTFSEYLSEDCTLYIIGDSSCVFIDKTKAQTLGITEKIAQQFAEKDDYYPIIPYEMTLDLECKIIELGGKVFN